MEFNYNDYFNQKDIISISKEDVDYILGCDKPTFKEISGKNIDEIQKKLSGTGFSKFKGLDQSIIYIKADKTITLSDQSKVLEATREIFKTDIEIIYGVGIDDSMKGIKVLLIASKKKV